MIETLIVLVCGNNISDLIPSSSRWLYNEYGIYFMEYIYIIKFGVNIFSPI